MNTGSNRRQFLTRAGALALGYSFGTDWVWGLTPNALDEKAKSKDDSSQERARSKTLVVVFLRGGADGLNLVVPYGDSAYATLRPTIGIRAPGRGDAAAVDLDGHFGLHPRLAPLAPLFADGRAAALHAVGYDRNTRSHFEEQDTWETGVVGDTTRATGWANRYLASTPARGPVRAVAIGDALPRLLRGEVPAFAVRDARELSVPSGRGSRDAVQRALEKAYGNPLYRDAAGGLGTAGVTTAGGLDELAKAFERGGESKAPYPNTALARRLREVARLIRADLGVEIIEVDAGGWDTHNAQGGANGQFANLAGSLGGALAAFANDLGERLRDVQIVTLSDFGRTAAENGTGGTDHGWGNCVLAIGGALMNAEGKGPVRGDWPGLGRDELFQGRDLRHTSDFRDVIGDVLVEHMGVEDPSVVLPNHERKSTALFG